MMPTSSSKRLIVEGDADRGFFVSLCRKAGFLDNELWIGPPAKCGQEGNGKGNALQALEDSMDDLRGGQLTHLGIVVDADFSTSPNDGFFATYQRIADIVGNFGYQALKTPAGNHIQGFSFIHPRQLPTIGAWIMPDNNSDGYLEHFCIGAADSGEAEILTYAKNVVATIGNPKFAPTSLAKAETATWLAWQKTPGQGLNSLVGNNLLNTNCAAYKGLLQWLITIFRSG